MNVGSVNPSEFNIMLGDNDDMCSIRTSSNTVSGFCIIITNIKNLINRRLPADYQARRQTPH